MIYTHTREQFLKMIAGLGLEFCVFWFSLDYFVLVLFAFVVLGIFQYCAKRLAGKNFS